MTEVAIEVGRASHMLVAVGNMGIPSLPFKLDGHNFVGMRWNGSRNCNGYGHGHGFVGMGVGGDGNNMPIAVPL